MSEYPMREGGARLLDAMLYGDPQQGSHIQSDDQEWPSLESGAPCPRNVANGARLTR